jgi:hypothetical protein
MHFAYPLPWWVALLLAAAVGAVAFAEYRRPLAPLSHWQRGALAGLRVMVLGSLVLFQWRWRRVNHVDVDDSGPHLLVRRVLLR